jgi:polyisoprenoid-binding protein YceI
MSGELSLQRTDFNIGTGEWSAGDIIGLEVDVRFEVALEPEG